MSITKGQLKSIVKECLLEILSEGIGPSSASSLFESAKKQQPKNQASVASVVQQNASKIKYGTASSSANNLSAQTLKETIMREAGGNKLMADIFADTAANSLPTMIENDRKKVSTSPVGIVERAVASHTPEQLFGEDAASKWAALAFADPTNKIR